jgi:hypothetical protein
MFGIIIQQIAVEVIVMEFPARVGWDLIAARVLLDMIIASAAKSDWGMCDSGVMDAARAVRANFGPLSDFGHATAFDTRGCVKSCVGRADCATGTCHECGDISPPTGKECLT